MMNSYRVWKFDALNYSLTANKLYHLCDVLLQRDPVVTDIVQQLLNLTDHLWVCVCKQIHLPGSSI